MHRKLYTSNPLFARISDKCEVRSYVQEVYEIDILTDLYHVAENPSTIPFHDLPNEFVLKPTHASGLVKIVTDMASENSADLIRLTEQWLSQRVAPPKMEYWYDDITPRIMVEERLPSDSDKAPLDFKLFVFGGSVEYIEVDFDRFSNHTRRFYSPSWEPHEFRLKRPLGPTISEPPNLDKMIDVAETLGEEFEFVRVDLYDTPDGVKFGELTLAPESGGGRFYPLEYDFKLGDCWEKNN